MVNSNLFEIKDLVEEIEIRIGKIKELIEETQPSEASSKVQITRMKILAEVYKKKGVVTKEEWKQIGENYKMDPRGLGGFFVGDGSMVRIGDGKRALTEKGARIAKKWLEDEG